MDPMIDKQIGEWRLGEMRRQAELAATARQESGGRSRARPRLRRAVGGALMSAGWRLAGGSGVRVDMQRHTILPED